MNGLDFERPIVELERKIEELRSFSADKKVDLSSEIKKLEEKLLALKKDIYENLTPWQKVQLARHPQRPYTLDYIDLMMTDFLELHGDRLFADDPALVGGVAKLDDKKIMVLGHQKGRDTKENLLRNFGCAHPEGYRKAIRLMEMAQRAKLPMVIFIDTPGAYPGVGAEERGQAQAIAYNLREMISVAVPIVIAIIGEGGSGGALGIGLGDKISILENAYYSVISPEGCASILWRNAAKAPEAAVALKLTAADLLNMGIVDEIIPEPLGGAHRDWQQTASAIKAVILRHLDEISQAPMTNLLRARYARFRRIGIIEEGKAGA
ncbi:MAG: acetyl-CoA carboxylase carboxyltransferase subunit alpha [Candidatus Omnitrophota bacterium]